MKGAKLGRNFIVIAGMPRAGTTFLYHNLQRHPGIYLPKRKELSYFSHRFTDGTDWFLGHYRGMKPDQIPFDICPAYFFDPQAIDRILDFHPHTKVILGLRDPADWVFSLYEQLSAGMDLPSFPDFLKGFSYVREGAATSLEFLDNMIATRISEYQAAFGRNLLIFDFNVLKDNPLALLKSIESFAGLAPFFEDGRFISRKINASGRRKSKALYRLLSVKGVPDLMTAILPRTLLQWFRRRVEIETYTNRKGMDTAWMDRFNQEDRRLAELAFMKDRKAIEALFRNGRILSGDGTVFPTII